MINGTYRTRRRVGQVTKLIGGVLFIVAVVGVVALIGFAVTSSQFWNSSP